MEDRHESTEQLLQRCAVLMRKAKRLSRNLGIEIQRNMGLDEQDRERNLREAQPRQGVGDSFV